MRTAHVAFDGDTPSSCPRIPRLAWLRPASIAFALAMQSSTVACDKKSDAPAPAATAASAAPATANCPAGSTKDTSGCKATRTARVATIAWNGVTGESSQTLTVKNSAGAPLKDATIAIWFYDAAGKRLDIAGSKKYRIPGDGLGGTINAGASKDITLSVAKATLPTGAAEIEGELVKATLVNPDGSDGPIWQNDDLNADERVMTGTPPPGAVAAAAAAAAAMTKAPAVSAGRKPPPPTPPAPPPKHR
jgi:hypothetical protein